MTDYAKEHDFSQLKALFFNCTLKKSPERSNTAGLMQLSKDLMERQGVQVEMLRLSDFYIPSGIYPDMTEHGYDKDEWTDIWPKVKNADIIVVGTPIWLGEKSSLCKKLIERLYAHSAEKNEKGQFVFYGKVGGCVITGNEDGVKHCSMGILYSLQHLGYTVPPQADAGWIGEAGPGPSYLDKNSGGPENNFTNRNTTFMTWNLLHMAKLLKDNGGLPNFGNDAKQWEKGERFGFQNKYREEEE